MPPSSSDASRKPWFWAAVVLFIIDAVLTLSVLGFLGFFFSSYLVDFAIPILPFVILFCLYKANSGSWIDVLRTGFPLFLAGALLLGVVILEKNLIMDTNCSSKALHLDCSDQRPGCGNGVYACQNSIDWVVGYFFIPQFIICDILLLASAYCLWRPKSRK